MRSITKRFMDLVILAGIVFLALNLEYVKSSRSQPQDLSKFVVTLNQTLWEKYGPGSRDAYCDLFSSSDFPSARGTPDTPLPPFRGSDFARSRDSRWEAPVDAARTVSCPRGLIGVPEAPDWFHKQLDDVEILAASLEAVLAKGPYVPAPDEVDFADPIPRSPSFFTVQQGAKSLRYLATRDWLSGNTAKATTYLTQILSLGDALEPSPDWLPQAVRPNLYATALDGLSTLVWMDPKPPDNQFILQMLESVETSKWGVPAPNGISFWTYLRTLSTLPAWYPPDSIPATYLLGATGRDVADEATEVVLHQTRIVPDRRLAVWEIANRLGKWTTLPAMRRRAVKIAESYFETDPLLPADAAKVFPRLTYLGLRARSSDRKSLTKIDELCAYHKKWLEVLRATYRVRQWRDEQNRWPLDEEFGALVPPDAALAWHVLTDSEPLAVRFLAMHSDWALQLNPELRARGPDPDNPAVLYFPLPADPTEFVPHLVNQGVTPTRAEITHWMLGILAAQPLVDSATATEVQRTPSRPSRPWAPLPQSPRLHDTPSYTEYPYGVFPSRPRYVGIPQEERPSSYPLVAARLRFPKRSYWVTHPGPDGQPDGPILSYDPSNGTVSRGDIVQLAGWEW